MEMSEEAEKALRESIKHWEVDVLEAGIFPGASNCPLCKLYYEELECQGCPISANAIIGMCRETPYNEYVDAIDAVESVRHALAGEMIQFMKDLLPENDK